MQFFHVTKAIEAVSLQAENPAKLFINNIEVKYLNFTAQPFGISIVDYKKIEASKNLPRLDKNYNSEEFLHLEIIGFKINVDSKIYYTKNLDKTFRKNGDIDKVCFEESDQETEKVKAIIEKTKSTHTERFTKFLQEKYGISGNLKEIKDFLRNNIKLRLGEKYGVNGDLKIDLEYDNNAIKDHGEIENILYSKVGDEIDKRYKRFF